MWSPRSARRLAPIRRSTARFRARYWLSCDAVTGQAATLTRAGTGTFLDTAGATVTAGYGAPRLEARAWGDLASAGVRLSTDDLTYPLDWLPGQCTVLVQFWELGTRTTAGAGLLYAGRDDGTGARLIVDSDGTNYRATIHNGTDDEVVTLSTATPTTNQGAALLVQLDDNGTQQRIRLGLRVEGVAGVTWTAWSGWQTRAAAWGSGAKLRLNRVGSSGTQGAVTLRQVAWVDGLHEWADVEDGL